MSTRRGKQEPASEQNRPRAPDASSRPSIEDVVRCIASEVPQEDGDALPADLIDNLDHYVYGTTKRADQEGPSQERSR